jgi:hypothetical protein
VATPAIFPVPTRPDNEIDKAWKEDIPEEEVSVFKSKEIICLKYRSCRNFVRTENHIPAPRHKAIRGLLQIIEFKLLTISSIKIFPQMLLS